MFKKTALFAALILIGLLAAFLLVHCRLPGGDVYDRTLENSWPGNDGEEKTRLTLYFGNNTYDPANPDSTALLAVIRTVAKTEAVARATVTELIRGPLPEELAKYDLAPVLNADAVLEDIYIRNGICVVRLAHEGSLLPPEGLPPLQEEQVVVESLVRSLTALPGVRAVWIFQNGSPWPGGATGCCGPFSLPGQGAGYKLYYLQNIPGEAVIPGPLIPVTVEIESPPGTAGAEGLFFRIVELLAHDYDQEHSAPLPADCRALSFSLNEGLLEIDLTGERTAGYKAARTAAHALVYTFTGLPEIDSVLATLDGETWKGAYFAWDFPLRREDLEFVSP